MRRDYHRLVRVGAGAACVVAVVELLGRDPPRPASRPAVMSLHVAPAPSAVSPGEALFATPSIDALPARGSGPPQLIGIVGRVSAPLAMVRLNDGAVRTIAAGEAAGGWTLESVAADRAIFRRGGEARVSVLPPRDAPQ